MTSVGTEQEARKPNNERIADALRGLNGAILRIKRLGQEINGTKEPTVETAIQPDVLPLSELIKSLPEQLNKAREIINEHVDEINEMIL